MRFVRLLSIIGIMMLFTACEQMVWNDPYPTSQAEANTLYLSFTEQPKRLDPAISSLVNENLVISQIYQPPLQYHYLQRPYTLIPQTVEEVPVPQYFDASDKPLPNTAPPEQIAYTLYTLRVKPGIYYQPHPAFAKQNGKYIYHDLSAKELADKDTLEDFPLTGTRELMAEDYVYQIKRLAAPNIASPILGLMRHYIFDLDEYAQKLIQVFAHQQNGQDTFIDLRAYPLAGAQVIDRYTYQIKVIGKYPQFLYWLAMNFFAPVPWEADAFYRQPGLRAKNISLNWYPIGTGPYQLSKNDPNRQMTLVRNPNFQGETFPTEGEPEDAKLGYLALAGQSLPFLDRIEFYLEKETIPQWSKFLQGYYDLLRLDADTFEQAIQITPEGFALNQQLEEKQLDLQMHISASVYYWGFNMLDPIVGGYTDKARKLRTAISLALNMDEYIAIFRNALGSVAQGPIPPEIFGYEAQQAVLTPASSNSHKERLQQAKQLLVEAGYPGGIDKKTGKRLVLTYDVATSGSPDDKARFGWLVKQLAQLGIEVEVRATQVSRFQQKMRSGDIQLFYWTWVGDYPDPENFLFLFHGPSSVVANAGNNRSNYQNPAYDKLFLQMRNMDNTPQRAAIIQDMIKILDHDKPWFGMFYPQTFSINQHWVMPTKPSDIVRNNLKYEKIDSVERAQKRKEWNKPVIWPLAVLGLGMMVALLSVMAKYYRKLYSRNRL